MINMGLGMLPLDSDLKLAVGSEYPGGQVYLGELAEGENFVYSLIIVVIFMGLGGTYRLEEDFKLIICGASHNGLGLFFIGGVDPSRHQVKIFTCQLEQG